MKHIMAICWTLLLAGTASAAPAGFECALNAFPKQTLSFFIQGLGTDQAELVFTRDDNGPVLTKSKNPDFVRIVDTLNAQGGDLRNIPAGIMLFGDAIGCDFAELVLYKNSGYTQGVLRTEYVCGERVERGYSPVRCFVR